MSKRNNLQKDICRWQLLVYSLRSDIFLRVGLQRVKVVSQTRRDSASMHNAVIAIIYAQVRGD